MSARRIPIEYYILELPDPATSQTGSGSAVIGYLADRPIFATVADSAGTCYRFVGVAARLPDGRYDIQSLSPGEWIVEPGLIYKLEDSFSRGRTKSGKSTRLAAVFHKWDAYLKR